MSGIYVYLGNNLITLQSKKQQTVLRSSTARDWVPELNVHCSLAYVAQIPPLGSLCPYVQALINMVWQFKHNDTCYKSGAPRLDKAHWAGSFLHQRKGGCKWNRSSHVPATNPSCKCSHQGCTKLTFFGVVNKASRRRLNRVPLRGNNRVVKWITW